GAITRVTASGHYDRLIVAPDGRTLYALRDTVDCPPRPVRLDATTADGEPTFIPAPGAAETPGRVERIDATGNDGTTVEAWLVRRIHGQLGRRPHRPVPLHRHAREPVGARPVLRDDGRPGLLDQGVRRADRSARALRRVVTAQLRPRHPHADARHPRR